MRTIKGRWGLKGDLAWKARLKAFLAKAKNKSRPSAADNLKATRLANWHSILGLDQSLRAIFGGGLSRFLPGRKLGPLRPGMERDLVEVGECPDIIRASSSNRIYRSLLVYEDGRTELEALYSGKRAVLHTVLDMGRIGWPARGWAFFSTGVRGERWCDVAHRRHNNFEDGIGAAMLTIFRSEALCLTNTNAGPWGGERKLLPLAGVWRGVP